MPQKILLVCGIASSTLYAAMIWAIRYEGYNPIEGETHHVSLISVQDSSG